MKGSRAALTTSPRWILQRVLLLSRWRERVLWLRYRILASYELHADGRSRWKFDIYTASMEEHRTSSQNHYGSGHCGMPCSSREMALRAWRAHLAHESGHINHSSSISPWVLQDSHTHCPRSEPPSNHISQLRTTHHPRASSAAPSHHSSLPMPDAYPYPSRRFEIGHAALHFRLAPQ